MKTAAVVLLAGLALSGCGSIMNRGPRAITVRTEPDGADCTVGGEVFKSPARVEISTRHNWTVSCRKDGFETAYMFVGSKLSGWTWGNSIMPWLFFGTLYDYNHDSGYFFDPGAVHMRLRPLAEATAKR